LHAQKSRSLFPSELLRFQRMALPQTGAIYRVMRTGTPELVPFVPDDMLVQFAPSEKHLRMMRELGIMSF
jgi:hypothetical protein